MSKVEGIIIKYRAPQFWLLVEIFFLLFYILTVKKQKSFSYTIIINNSG